MNGLGEVSEVSGIGVVKMPQKCTFESPFFPASD